MPKNSNLSESIDMIYHHRQFPPWWSLMIIIVFFVPVFLLAMDIVTWILILVGLIVASLFWGLTVEVNKDVVRLYFGLDGEEPMTLDKIGLRYGLTRERVRQIKEKALHRLRHPSRCDQLRTYSI